MINGVVVNQQFSDFSKDIYHKLYVNNNCVLLSMDNINLEYHSENLF
jgi:hypothetical protein